MSALIAPLNAILSGPLASVVGGVVGSVANVPGPGGNTGIAKLFDFAGGLVNLLGGPKVPSGLRTPSGPPSPFQLPQQLTQNLTSTLRNLSGALNGLTQDLGKLIDVFTKLVGGQQGAGQICSPFVPQGSVTPRTDHSRALNEKADSLMGKAQTLLRSDNPADQMKGQMLMQASQRLRKAAADPAWGIQNPAAQSLLNQAHNLIESDNPADQLKAQMLLQQAQGMGQGRPVQNNSHSRALNEKADSLMGKAQTLLRSDNPADQMKGQMLMQASQRLRKAAADPAWGIQNPAAQSLLNQAHNLIESDNPADQLKAQMLLQQAQRLATPAQTGPVTMYPGGSKNFDETGGGRHIVPNTGGGLDATIDRVGSTAKSLMDQAQDLAASDNPADQMKAQRMMQQAQRMMECMSNMVKIIGDMQKNAIQNMR